MEETPDLPAFSGKIDQNSPILTDLKPSTPFYAEQDSRRCHSYLAFLRHVLRTYKVHSILDVGCGDFGHLSTLDFSNRTYLGIDLAEPVILRNKTAWTSPNLQFRQSRLADLPDLGSYDLVLVKEVMQCLPTAEVQQMLGTLQRTARRVLVTNDYSPFDLHDCTEGGTRPLDVEGPPFNLPAFERFKYIVDGKTKKTVLWLRDPSEGIPAYDATKCVDNS